MSRQRAELSRQRVLRSRAREMRNEMPVVEKLLWLRLRGDQLGARFRRQLRIKSFIADFACPAAKLVVEIDGDSHGDRAKYDAQRTEVIERCGYRVIRFTNDDVITNLDGVVEAIARHLNEANARTPLPNPLP